jgi:hypothetical protein
MQKEVFDLHLFPSQVNTSGRRRLALVDCNGWVIVRVTTAHVSLLDFSGTVEYSGLRFARFAGLLGAFGVEEPKMIPPVSQDLQVVS